MGDGQEIMFGVRLLGYSRHITEEKWAIIVPWAMCRNSATHCRGCGGNDHNRKWQKTKELILELSTLLREGKLHWKQLERIRGFLIYISQTFRWMAPYLKGLHLTIDGGRPGRDNELWPEYSQKPKDQQWEVRVWKWNSESWMEEGETDKEDMQEEHPLELVNPAPRLTLDVEALEKLTSSKNPATTKCRVEAAMSTLYLMGDTSGQGFGSGL